MSGSCCLYGFAGNKREHSCFSCVHKPEGLKHPGMSELLLAEPGCPAWCLGGTSYGGMCLGGMHSGGMRQGRMR